jgi:hypothetical protein
MDRMRTLRNVAIVLALAAVVRYLPGGGRGASAVEAALWVAFGIGIGFLLLRLYREQRVTIHGLGDRHRAMLYGAAGIGLFLWAARTRMWETGLGELGWWLLLGWVVYSVLEVYRHSRTY